MQEYTNEHEQWEAIRDWWKKNGMQLILIFCASLLITFSFRYWQSHQLEKKQEASQLFDQLLAQEKVNSDAALIPRIAAELKKDYPRTTYAPLAALFQAKSAVAKNDLAGAEQELLWAIDHSKSAAIRSLATLRLARVLLANEKPKAALALLEKDTDNDYYPAIEQIKGDIYLAQKKIDKARRAYQNAFAALPPSAPLKNDVQMQLNQLPANN